MPDLPDRSISLPTVTLPLAHSGIRDERASFALLFREELARAGRSSPAEAGAWLHELHDVAAPLPVSHQDLRARFADRAPSTSVLIVPGLFDDCAEAQAVPFGDGVLRTPERSRTEAYLQYADLALLGVRSIALPGRISSGAAGEIVAGEIRREARRAGLRRIVVVGYSKGVPDTLHALARLQADRELPGALVAVVSVAGAGMGTPIADHVERLFETVSPAVQPLDCSPSDAQEMSSLTRRERVAWLSANPLPEGIRYYSVITHASASEVSLALRPMHSLLSAFDRRNDGQLLASDMFLPGSILLAETRADHWDVALPRTRHPSPLWRALGSGRDYPREALFRALVQWVVGAEP